MHTNAIEAREALVRRHAQRVGSRADRVVDLFIEHLHHSGVGSATRERIRAIVAFDPAALLTALAQWPARIIADHCKRGEICTRSRCGLPSRDLALARVALVAALRRVSHADWSDDLDRAWCWRLDTICDLLAEPIGQAVGRAA